MAAREKGQHPFFDFLTLVFDVMWLNILTIAVSLPVFTAGAALSAMYTVILKMVRKESPYVTRTFFRAFKRNFRTATMLWIFYLIPIVTDVIILAYLYAGQIERGIPLYVMALISVVILGSGIYCYVLVARYDSPAPRTFLNSWILAFGYLPRTLGILGVTLGFWYIIYATYPYLLPLILICGLTLPGYASVQLMVPVLKSAEGDSWDAKPDQDDDAFHIAEDADYTAFEESDDPEREEPDKTESEGSEDGERGK